MTSLENLTAALTAETTVGDGMKTLLGTLVDEIKALKTDQTPDETDAAIDALTAKLTAKTAEWTAAVKDVPPVAPPPPPASETTPR